MSIFRTGLNPLSYIGVEPVSAPLLVLSQTNPTASTVDSYNLGTLWLNQSNNSVWILVSIVGVVGNWIMLGTGSGGIFEYDTNAGTVVPISGITQVRGGSNINTSGSGNIIRINLNTNFNLSNIILSGILTVGNGLIVTGPTSITGTVTLPSLGSGVVQSSNTGVLSASNGTNGEVLIGGGTAPVWTNLTSTGGSIAITNGVNSIDLESTGTAAFISLAGNSGTATNLAGVITVDGGTNMNTIGSGHNLTISTSATPTFTSITTTTLDSTSNFIVDGTLTISTLPAGVVQTTSVGQFLSSNGTNGQVLIGGGTAPEWMNLTSTFGSFTITNGPNTINLETSSVAPGLFNAIIMPHTNIGLTQGVIDIGNTAVPNYPVFHAYDNFPYASASGYFKGGSTNIFVGSSTGNPTNTGGTGGYQNVALGAGVLGNMTGSEFLNSASGNVGIGAFALSGITTGSYNTCIGDEAGGNLFFIGTNLMTGNYNIMIGFGVGQASNTNINNNLYISSITATGNNNLIDIGSNAPGGTITSCKIAGIYGQSSTVGSPLYASFNSVLGTSAVSSFHLKKEIYDIGYQSSDIYNINPVSFIYKDDQTNTKTYGLIAEEVAQEFPELGAYEDGTPIGVKYHNLGVLILNEMKKLKNRIMNLRKRLPSG